MAPGRIPDEAALLEALAAERYLLFKHSFRCPTSAAAFEAYRAFAAAHPGLPTGWIDVVLQRPLAHLVADRTGVPHESPQALWIRDGSVVWHESHRAITEASLGAAVDA